MRALDRLQAEGSPDRDKGILRDADRGLLPICKWVQDATGRWSLATSAVSDHRFVLSQRTLHETVCIAIEFCAPLWSLSVIALTVREAATGIS